VKPKHHWALDLPAQLRRDGVLVDCFIIERKHLFVKKAAAHIDNTSRYEESVIATSVGIALRDAREGSPIVGHCLLGPSGEIAGMRAARQLQAHGFVVTVGDMVLLSGSEVGMVRACVATDGNDLGVIVNALSVVRSSSRFKLGHLVDELVVWRAEDLQQCIAWRAVAGGMYEVVHQ
jgi:hypothetical protein